MGSPQFKDLGGRAPSETELLLTRKLYYPVEREKEKNKTKQNKARNREAVGKGKWENTHKARRIVLGKR